MTPMLLMQAAKILRPAQRKLIASTLLGLILGLIILAFTASLEAFSLNLFLLAWVSLGTGMLCFGLTVITQLYSKKPEPPSGCIASKIQYNLSQVARTISAPFFTLWLIGIAILIPGGMLILLIQHYTS